jgi:hypothetical protein
MAKLRMMWSELYRMRRVNKHCYEYAQLAVLARLHTPGPQPSGRRILT